MKRYKLFIILLFIGIYNLKCQTIYESYKFTGTVGNTEIVLTFKIPGNWYNYDQGEYYYTKYKTPILFKGNEQKDLKDKRQKLIESNNGKETGYFIFYSNDYFLNDIILGNNIIIGKWYNMDESISYDVILYKEK